MRVKKIAFTTVALDKLKTALDGYEDFYKAEIEAGRADLWQVDGGESYAITRLEYDERLQGDILILCCYEGQRILDYTRQLIKTCKNLGLVGLRIHSHKPGIWRMAEGLGFNELERVYFHGL